MFYLLGRRKVASEASLNLLMRPDLRPNYRAALDAGIAFCYISSVVGPARVGAGRFGKETMRRLVIPAITMGLFSSLFGCSLSGEDGRFQSDDAYAQSRAKQLTMTPQTIAQLRKYEVTDRTQLRLEYFFYTNTKEKAAALAGKLAGMGYTAGSDHSASDKKRFVVTGWTSPMKMDDQTVLDWTGRMCDVGHEHDCEFDGWGTNPKQP
jgi:hypothetical protein